MIRISEEVALALKEHKPVVALETTIISHGMPYPKNVETALAVEQVIRNNGATPATIGIIDGKVVVGMSKSEIEAFGIKKDIVKVSRRDLPYVLAKKKWGATTVAATMIVAEKAGIEVFVTGGIGGVHRGATETFDISADLEELANTNVTVVCAGAKAILDLGLTLEYLETKGVPVYGYKTKILPAFYTNKSNFFVDEQIDNADEFAELIKVKRDNNLRGGILITNPIPHEYSLDSEEIEKVIEQAIKQAEAEEIHGKETTPYLLSAIVKATNGKSLEANIKLILNNAKLGAEIASALSKKIIKEGAR